MNKCRTVYLGLGSNLSHPKLQIQKAIQLLADHPEILVTSQAPYYQTPPWGVTDQADFINSALSISTTLCPLSLLDAIKHIEYHQMGRIKNKRWHERLIDIDILLYENWHITQPELTIPHPLIADRWFVILPLLALQPTLPVTLAQTIHNKLDSETIPQDLIKI